MSVLGGEGLEEGFVHALEGRHDAGQGGGGGGMLLLIVLGCRTPGGSGCGNIKGGHEIGLLGGRGLGTVAKELRDLGSKAVAALHIHAQGGTDEHQGTETAMGRAVGHADMAVVEQVVEGGCLGTLVAYSIGVLDTTVEDGYQLVLDIIDEMVVEKGLDGARQVKVGGLVARELQRLLATEEGNAQGDADAMGGMLDVEHHRLGILEAALGNDNGIEIVDILDGRTEGKALAVLTTEGDEGCHHLVGHDDATTFATEVEMHVQTAFAIPAAADQTCHLDGTGLDEHKMVHGATKGVDIVSILRLLGQILGILVGDGLGEKLVRHKVLEEAQTFLSALLILLLQVVLYQLRLEM